MNKLDIYLSSIYVLCVGVFFAKYAGLTISYVISRMYDYYSNDMVLENSIWTVYLICLMWLFIIYFRSYSLYINFVCYLAWYNNISKLF